MYILRLRAFTREVTWFFAVYNMLSIEDLFTLPAFFAHRYFFFFIAPSFTTQDLNFSQDFSLGTLLMLCLRLSLNDHNNV